MFYHKVYMNQIHSSSLLCQLASMWKNQVLCDAVIKTGNTQTKAHRVVLVAACPMLHSMKNASVGSNLEVRLAADIKQESITTFLQYLYEGFMMLTEENCKDVEKIARVLQVDSVLKCCADFYKCLHSGDKYEYTFHDNVEFRHTRSSEMLRAQERSKRAADMQPASPGVKRQRIQSRGSTDMLYGESDPWDRVPRDGLLPHTGRTSQPGVIEIMEDSVEILHSDPPDDSGGTRRPNPVDRLGISVASNMKSSGEIQIVNMSGTTDSSSRLTASGDMSPRFSISHPNTSQGNSNFSQEKIQRQDSSNFPNPNTMTVTSRVSSAPSSLPRMASPSYNIQSRPPTISKPFAAGNASQASKSFNVSSPSEHSRSGHSEASRITSGASTLSFSSPNSSVGAPSPVSPSLTSQPQPVALWRSSSSEALGSAPPPPSQPPDKPTVQRSDSAPQADADTDLAIVKIESDTEFGNIEIPDDPRDDTDDQSAEWGQEEVSNEGSNEDKMPQWMTDSLKASETDSKAEDTPTEKSTNRSKLSEYIDKLHELQAKAMYFDMSRHKHKQDPPDQPDGSTDPSSVLRGLDLTIRTPAQQQHIPIYNKDRKYTPCLYCGRLKNRTRSGWRVNTFYRCLQCDVPLCVNDRNCFVLYHKYFLGLSNVESPGRRRSRDMSHIEVKKESNG